MTDRTHDPGTCATVIRLDERSRNDSARIVLLEELSRDLERAVGKLDVRLARMAGWAAGAAAVGGVVGGVLVALAKYVLG